MIYTIYNKADSRPLPDDESGDSRFDGIVAVPEHASPWAVIFPPFWLAYHRLWFALMIYIGVMVVILSLLSTPYAIVVLLLGGLPGIYLFLEGNQLRRNSLQSRGNDLIGVVDAPNAAYAVEKFLYNWRESDRISSNAGNSLPSKLKNDDPGIGLFAEARV